MNAIAEGCLIEAANELEDAIIALDNQAHNGEPELLRRAAGHLLRCRGQLTALRQMVDLSREVNREPPALRSVR